nr:putative transporter aqr1 [Quercus suber]
MSEIVANGGMVEGSLPNHELRKEQNTMNAETASSQSRPTSSSTDTTQVIDREKPEDQSHRQDDARDLEALDAVQTNTAPWSVFTMRQKRTIVILVAIAGFFSPLSANIYFPALNTLAAKFNVSASIINLTLTSYMIFQGLAPTIFGDLSDMAGRRPAYIIGFAVYIGACVGLACCDSYAALLVLRCLQSTGSSGTIALGSGVVADIATSADRGVWMGWATSGPMVAPALAPVLGGIFAEFLGWRWIFWFLVILAGAFMIPFLAVFPETGRNVVGNGSIPPQGWNMSLLNLLSVRRARSQQQQAGDENVLSRTPSRHTLQARRHFRLPNPLNTLVVIFEKDVALLLFYNSLVYCAFYDVMASFPSLLASIYNYNALQIGLCFLPFGVGCFLAPFCIGRVMDWNFRRTAARIHYTIHKGRANDLRAFPIEQARIQVEAPLLGLGIACLLAYGWTLTATPTPLPALLVLQFIMGLTLTGAFNAMSVMLVDLYPLSPATATAANNLVRCLMGAGATAVIDYMIQSMGRGGCFSFIAGVVVLFSPILYVLQRWGPQWREARRVRVEAEKARKTDAPAATTAPAATASMDEDDEKSKR